jgi:hypothetical protein
MASEGRDERVDLAVFPPRKRVALEMEIDAARRDEPGCASLCRRRSQRQRQRRHGDAVRIVRVDHVRRQPLDDAGEAPRGGQIHFRSRRHRDQFQPFGRAAPELAVRMRHERRPLADRSQSVHGQQHLVLAAAPRTSRVNVQRKHQLSTFKSQLSRLRGSEP